MAATRNRKIEHLGDFQKESYKVKANVHIYQGTQVSVDATGYLIPASTAAGQVVQGIALEEVDNTGGADGAKTCEVGRGIYALKNHGVSPVGQADMGRKVFVADDETVAVTGLPSTIVAGILKRIDGADVFVDNRGIGLV